MLAVRFVEYLLLPPASTLLLMALGLILLRRWPLVGYSLSAFGLVALYLASIPVVSYGLLNSLQARYSELKEIPESAQAIVVLGGGRNPGAGEGGRDTVSKYALERLRYAARLQRKTGLPLLLSGGRVYDEPLSEAQLAKELLETDFGVSAQWLEEQSRNTFENALYTKAKLEQDGVEHVLLVTHGWHMPRAMWSFNHVGLRATPAPASFSQPEAVQKNALTFLPQAEALLGTKLALHEWLGKIWYLLRYGRD